MPDLNGNPSHNSAGVGDSSPSPQNETPAPADNQGVSSQPSPADITAVPGITQEPLPTGESGDSAPSADQTPDTSVDTPAANTPPAESDAWDPKFLVTTLPPDRNSDEYWEAYDKLSSDDRNKIAQELVDLPFNKDLQEELNEAINRDVKAKEGLNDVDKDSADDKSADADGDSNAPDNSDIKISADQFKELAPEVQEVVQEMQKTITDLGKYADPDFQEGLKVFTSDPIIAARSKELQEGKTLDQTMEDLKTNGFDPNDIVDSKEFSEVFGKNNMGQEQQQWLSNKLHDAANAGFQQATKMASVVAKQGAARQEIRAELDKQVAGMISKNPSMASDLATNDPNHPLSEFFKWTDGQFSTKQVNKLGVAEVFKMYNSVTGGEQKSFDNVIKDTKLKFLDDMESIDKTARTMLKGQGTPQQTSGQMYNGIDLGRYNKDPGYAERMYDQANWDTQKGLEYFKYNGKLPS